MSAKNFYGLRRGGTESDLLFLLIMVRITAGAEVEAALGQVLRGVGDASDDKPPSLYLKPQPGGWAIASEPLGDDAEAWSPVDKGELVLVHQGRLARRPLA